VIDFTLTQGACNGSHQVSVTISGVTGGASGQYEANTTYYSSQANAITGTFSNFSSSSQINGVPSGTWYFAVRDKITPSYVNVKSIVVFCPTPTPTSTPTPTPTSEPEPTVTPTPTATATNTPTPTPTPVPTYTYTVYLSETSDYDACRGGNTSYGSYYLFHVTGNTNNMCSSTTFKISELPSLDFGTFWISDGTNSRNLQRSGGPSSINATAISGCAVCPQPTATPTPTATPVPPTATPTPTATPIPDPSANWINNGSYQCSGCDKHYQQTDYNQYSPTYGQTRLGAVAEYNSTFCGGCCGQSTTPNWQWDSESTVCVGYDLYTQEMDINSCSSTYLNTRAGTVLEYNSTSCGYVAPTPTPTPIPENPTYDVYESCGNPGNYYSVYYSPNNSFHSTINGECCYKIDTNVNQEYINTIYGSVIGPSFSSNDNCRCDQA
jgi:hypothetical protein